MHAKKDSETNYSIKAVNKTLEILEVLSEVNQEGASLARIASQVGLSRNNAFRILRTLCDKGLVEQDRETGHYRLGFFSAAFAQKMLKNMNVITYAHPVLEKLARKHDEAIYLTVLKDDDVLFLDMVDCDQQIKTAPLLGRLVPFFSNAAGKVMKSFDSRDLLERLLKKKGPKELENLDRELYEIRTQGVAIDRGGLGEGIISVAVAIRDYTGRVVGAITLIGPSFRMLTERLEKEIIPSLKEGAELLSCRFGYCPA
jgi:DNA-binding IclR family transcriptional regulator